MRTPSRLGRALPGLALLLLVRLCLPGPPAMAAPALLEDLRYRVEVLTFPDAARVQITLKRLSPERFAAEVTGDTQGFIKLISGGHRERLHTEMVWRHRRLLPLIYREETWRNGRHGLKEYRFDYPRGRLELWEWHQGKGLSKKWQTDLAGQVYDPLSAFYNIRLGIIGPHRQGETNTIQGIPYPQPESMEVRLGSASDSGLEAMVSLINPVFAGSRGVVFASVDKQLVPQQAWTTVSGVTIRASLLPGSVSLPPGLPELTAPGSAASRRPSEDAPTATGGQGESR
ncbi:MAG: DUF3108 domain-containing protein [Desulfobaccales bacterium]